MFKDTLQISAELIESAISLHKLKFRHKWRVGDQFCVSEDCELFWQMMFPDCVYFVDNDLINLLDDFARKGVPIEQELGQMVFIPTIEDIAEFCAASVFNLELSIIHEPSRPAYHARLRINEKEVLEEVAANLRIAAIRVIASALQRYVSAGLPSHSVHTPI